MPPPAPLRRILLATVLWAAAPGVGAGPAHAQEAGADPSAVLERASERYGEIRGFCAEFSQLRIVPLLDQETRSRGRLCQMQPGYFRMDFSEPEGDLVVSDGEHVWTYYPSVDPGQVIRASLGAPGGATFDFHREFVRDAESRFRVRLEGADTVSGRATDVLELRPRRPEAGYVRARVWIEAGRGLIRKVEIEEENGSLRRVTLSDVRLDPGLDASRFAFEPPEGVQVIRR